MSSRLYNTVSHALAAVALCTAPQVRADAHVLEARMTLGSVSTRDDLLVPLAFTGPSMLLGARFAYVGDEATLGAELELGAAVLFERFGEPALQFQHGLALRYEPVLARDDTLRTTLGLALRQHDDLAYFATWDDSHGYWLSTLTLGLAASHERAFWPGHDVWLEAHAELALLGLAARPPRYRWNKLDALTQPSYHLDRLHDARWVSLLELQAVRAEALLRFRTAADAPGSGWGVGVATRLGRATWPETFASLYVGLVGSYGWSL